MIPPLAADPMLSGYIVPVVILGLAVLFALARRRRRGGPRRTCPQCGGHGFTRNSLPVTDAEERRGLARHRVTCNRCGHVETVETGGTGPISSNH